MTGDHLTIDVLRYPGSKVPARAILTVPGSSVLPSGITHFTARRPAVAPPSGSQPVAVSSLARTPLPNFPGRASAADAFTGALLTDFAAAQQFIPARPCSSSGLRQKPYPRNRRMSTMATIDFMVAETEVICSEMPDALLALARRPGHRR